MATSCMSARMEHSDKLDRNNPILSLKTQTRKPLLQSVIQPRSLQEIFCESAPNTWRENKICEGADRFCIDLRFPCGKRSRWETRASQWKRCTNSKLLEVPRNPQPAPPLGKLMKDDVLQCYLNVFRPGDKSPLGTPMYIELDPNVRPVHAQEC